MRKLIIGAAALTGLFATSAMAADMPVKAPVYKAPPPVYSWTGFYVAGGGGGGMWNQDYYMETDPGHVATSPKLTGGGRGWLATVQAGFDVQLNNIVLGAFADADWSNLKGTWLHELANVQGNEKQRSAWAVGARAGLLITPTLLTFVDGGYTQARFSQIDLFSTTLPVTALGTHIPSNTYSGWFLGTGLEYATPWIPGLFWKNEYRYSSYREDDLPIVLNTTGLTTGTAINSRKDVQTYRSELVYRFNWSRPVVARY